MQGGEEQESVREVVLAATRALVGVAARSLADVSDEVTLAQYRILVLLDGRGPMTMGEFATSLDVNPSTVTRVCDVLVDKKLIRRVDASHDRRGVRAELTARGHRLVDVVMDHRRRLIDDALARLSPDRQRRLARSLAEFATAVGQTSQDAWLLGWALDRDDDTRTES